MQLSGLASGMDTNAIVQSLVSTTIDPQKNAIYGRKQSNNAEISALGQLKSSMNELKDAAEALEDANLLNPTQASSSDESKIRIDNANTNFRGQIDVNILQKATAHSLASAVHSSAEVALGAGAIEISNSAGETFKLDIDADASSLVDIAASINQAEDNFGVSATLVKHKDGEFRLLINAQQSGSDNQLSISVSDQDGDNTDTTGLSSITEASGWTTTEAAQNAVVEFKGLRFERSSNVIDNALEGVSFDISGAEKDDTVTLKIEQDSSGQKKAVDDLITAYNNLQAVVAKQSSENSAFEGDSLTRGLRSSMRSAFSAANSNGSFLFEIGVEIDRYGKANIGQTELDAALKTDPNAIIDAFTGDGGVAARLLSTIDGYLDNKEGQFATRESSIMDRQERLDERLSALDRRSVAYESRLRSQFSAMEGIISKFSTMGSFLNGFTTTNYNND